MRIYGVKRNNNWSFEDRVYDCRWYSTFEKAYEVFMSENIETVKYPFGVGTEISIESYELDTFETLLLMSKVLEKKENTPNYAYSTKCDIKANSLGDIEVLIELKNLMNQNY